MEPRTVPHVPQESIISDLILANSQESSRETAVMRAVSCDNDGAIDPRQSLSAGNPYLSVWEDLQPIHRLTGEYGSDFSALMREVDFLMGKGTPLGLAFVVGEMDWSLCRQIKKTLARQADYVSWVAMGPLLIAVFREGLFDDLCRAWRLVVADNKGITAGVAFSHSLKTPDEFMAAGRHALQKALDQRAKLLVLSPDEAVAAIANQNLSVAMKKDLADGGENFKAFFQPQVEIATGIPVGAEAVARWAPDCIEVPPSQFIAIAEENGLIAEIGRIVFAHSVRAIKVLRDSEIQIPHISINVSPVQLVQGDFLRMALDTLRGEGLTPADIELEITESLVGSGSGEFLRSLADVAAAGFRIVIDEFGTGTSSLARIREISAGKIKLDRAFITRLPNDQTACTMCRMALDLVHGLGKKSLAYGVERHEQAAYLSSLGCTLGQGFLWARPMSADDLVAWWAPGRMN